MSSNFIKAQEKEVKRTRQSIINIVGTTMLLTSVEFGAAGALAASGNHTLAGVAALIGVATTVIGGSESMKAVNSFEEAVMDAKEAYLQESKVESLTCEGLETS